MMTASRAEPGPTYHTAAMFEAPGRPRPLARRLAIHNRVVRALREFFAADGFHEMPVTALADDRAAVQLDGMLALGFDAVWCESEIIPRAERLEPRHLRGFKLMEAARSGCNVEGLGDQLERLLKSVAGKMTADLLGGRDVTRLDRMLRMDHRRLDVAEAASILEDMGWAQADDHSLPPGARATLTRHCGNLPCLLVTPPPEEGGTTHVQYVLPYAGVTCVGETGPGRDGRPRSRFELDLGRLLQYLMGLGDISDTLIDPMDRLGKVMRDVAPGTGLTMQGGGV